MNDNKLKNVIIHNSENNECPHCKFLYETFLADSEHTHREYYLMTEVFVYLHGGNVCNYATENKIQPLEVKPIEGIEGLCKPGHSR